MSNHVPPLTILSHERGFFKLTCRRPFLQFHPIFPTKILLGSSSLSEVVAISASSSSSLAVPEVEDDDHIDEELRRLLALVPEEIRRRLEDHPEISELIEIVLDLGRKPLARFPSGDFVISDDAVRFKDLEFAVSQVGECFLFWFCSSPVTETSVAA